MIIEAILKINPNAIVNVRGEDIDTCEIEWLEETSEISKANIKTKMAELQVEYDAKQYQRDRVLEYPSLKEFAEAYCEKEIGNTTTKWDAYIIKYNKVRTDNPK